MSDGAEKAAEWVYRGIWRVLSDWFRVPDHPPTLPVEEGEFILSFHPSRRYMRYLKLYFWIVLVVIRRLIMERVQRSKLAGLGDEGPSAPASRTWSVEHLRPPASLDGFVDGADELAHLLSVELRVREQGKRLLHIPRLQIQQQDANVRNGRLCQGTDLEASLARPAEQHVHRGSGRAAFRVLDRKPRAWLPEAWADVGVRSAARDRQTERHLEVCHRLVSLKRNAADGFTAAERSVRCVPPRYP